MRFLRVYLTIIFFSIIFFLYLSELFLMYYFPKGNLHIRDLKDKVEKYKQLTSNEFDLRTKVQIYEDLRKKNNKVSLVLSPKSLIDKNSNLDFLILSA